MLCQPALPARTTASIPAAEEVDDPGWRQWEQLTLCRVLALAAALARFQNEGRE